MVSQGRARGAKADYYTYFINVKAKVEREKIVGYKLSPFKQRRVKFKAQ